MKELTPPTRLVRLFRSALLLLCLTAGFDAQAQMMEIPKPSAGLMPNPAAGKRLYAANCAACHGADLKGACHGAVDAAQGL